MKIAFVFPGQGSQSVGMLDAWSDNSVIRNIIARASIVLGSDLGSLISEGPAERLNLTVNTQPAMFAADVAFFEVWKASGGAMPAIMAGHSLGEYSALASAGAFSLEDGIKLVETRAHAVQDILPVGIGCMAVIIGLDTDILDSICVKESKTETVEIANFNTPTQNVISGHKSAVERVCISAKSKGARHAFFLPVSAPFHCSLLKPASNMLALALDKISFNFPKVDVINNVDVAIVRDPDSICNALIRQIWNPVRWVEIIEFMKKQNVTHIVECGPGKVLSGLTRRMCPEMVSLSITDPPSLQNALSKTNII